MKVARSTRQRIEEIKVDAIPAKQILERVVIRFSEHNGTKRMVKNWERVLVAFDRALRAS